jgi:diketogulonate reductase-like aldo/keto reductase
MTSEIGVSNYQINHLKELLRSCKYRPAVNQIEFNPIVQQRGLVGFCQKEKIAIQGYSLLKPYFGNSRRNNLSIKEKNVITKIANKHKTSAPQVILK